MMLRLQIENLALIERAELELSPGLNVFSGETGAGKTMLAQAIGLLAGLAQRIARPIGASYASIAPETAHSSPRAFRY